MSRTVNIGPHVSQRGRRRKVPSGDALARRVDALEAALIANGVVTAEEIAPARKRKPVAKARSLKRSSGAAKPSPTQAN